MPLIVHEVLRSPGQPLDASTRAFMEPRFGHDFSHVRIHTNPKAAESARAVRALAYTVNNHIVMGSDQHAPGLVAGRLLVAHELAHVVQQSADRVGSDSEAGANLVAQSIVEGRPVTSGMIGTASIGLHRQHDKGQGANEGAPPDLDELKRRLLDPGSMLFQAGLRQHQARKGTAPATLPNSPLFAQPNPAPWVKPGINLNLPQGKADKEPGVGVTMGDWRVFIGGSKKGDPKIPGDSIEDFKMEEINSMPKTLKDRLLNLISKGEFTISKKLGGK